jgi:hypothetical protein
MCKEIVKSRLCHGGMVGTKFTNEIRLGIENLRNWNLVWMKIADKI